MPMINKVVVSILIGITLGLGIIFFLIESSESQKKNIEQKEADVKKIYSGSIDGVARPRLVNE